MINLNWDDVKSVKILNEDFIAADFLPVKNTNKNEVIIGRTETMDVAHNQWPQIIDKDISSDYAKKTFVKSYFSTAIYLLKRVSSLSISPNQSYRQTIDISHTSSYRTTQNKSLRIENTLSGTANAEFGSLTETLTVSYGIEKMEEYFTEDRKSTTEEVMYDSISNPRIIVFWDFVKVLALYRTDKKGQTKLLAYNDFYVETYQKAYVEEV